MDDDGGDDFGYLDDSSDWGSSDTSVSDATDTSGSDFGDTSGSDGIGSDTSGMDVETFDQGDGSLGFDEAVQSGDGIDTGEDDSNGNPIVQNSDGTFTTYDAGTGDAIAQYDSSGNLLGTFGDSSDPAAGDTTAAATDTTGSDLGDFGTLDSQGNTIIGEYPDGLGNTVDITIDANSNLIYSTYDSAGNLISQTDASGNSLDGGASVAPADVGTGAAKTGGGSGGASGSLPGGGSSSGGSSGAGSGNSSALQALQSQLQALANALAAAQHSNSGVTVPQIQALQTRAGIVNGQIANLGGTPSSLFPTTGASSLSSLFSGNSGTILLVGGLALAAILFTRRPAPAPAITQAAA